MFENPHPDPVCESMRESISASLDGELSRLGRERLARHLDRCEACVHFAADLAVLVGVLRESPRATPGERPAVGISTSSRRCGTGVDCASVRE
jgi:predicted anti-sigma-YlaC factor YlaD